MRLEVTRTGYHTYKSPIIEVYNDAYQRIDFQLDVDPVQLSDIDVEANRVSTASLSLAGFERRRAYRMGWFTTREDFAKRAFARVTDVLRLALGVRTVPGIAHGGMTVQMGRSLHCPALIYIDGVLINRPNAARTADQSVEEVSVDDMITPRVVEGSRYIKG